MPNHVVREIVARQPLTQPVLILLHQWDGEAFNFKTKVDALTFRREIYTMIHDASYVRGTPLPPPTWSPEWDTFEVVIELYRPDTGWRQFID
jgi:hypothetical protein